MQLPINGAVSLMGNTKDDKGNTTEKLSILPFPQSIISLFFNHKGNTIRETLAWGSVQ